jgi:hypothetical protein
LNASGGFCALATLDFLPVTARPVSRAAGVKSVSVNRDRLRKPLTYAPLDRLTPKYPYKADMLARVTSCTVRVAVACALSTKFPHRHFLRPTAKHRPEVWNEPAKPPISTLPPLRNLQGGPWIMG